MRQPAPKRNGGADLKHIANGLTVAVDADTNLANRPWIVLATTTLSNGSACFSDPN